MKFNFNTFVCGWCSYAALSYLAEGKVTYFVLVGVVAALNGWAAVGFPWPHTHRIS